MKQGTFMDKHTKPLPSSMKQADFMDKSQDPGSPGTKQAEQPTAELRRLL